MNPEIREHLTYVAEHSPDPVERVKAQVRLVRENAVTVMTKAYGRKVGRRFAAKTAGPMLRKDDDRACPACGAMADDDDRFCPQCGGKLPVIADADGDQDYACTGCGMELDDDDDYCPSCGTARPTTKAERATARAAILTPGEHVAAGMRRTKSGAVTKAAIQQADGSFRSNALSQAGGDQALSERASAVQRRQGKLARRLSKADRRGDVLKAEKLRRKAAKLAKAAAPILTKRAAMQQAATDRQAAQDRAREMTELLGPNWSDPHAILRHQARVHGFCDPEPDEPEVVY